MVPFGLNNKIKWQGVIITIIIGSLFVSCTPAQQPTKPSATPTQIISTPLPITISPAYLPASSILDIGHTKSIPLGKDGSVSLSLGDNYIYWVRGRNNGYIFRVSIQGGEPEKIAETTYAGGRLDLFVPIVSGKWLIFGDTNTDGDPDTWKIRVLNLEDHTERVAWEVKGDTSGLIYSFAMAADDDTLVWVVGLPETSEDSVTLFNMATGEKREVLREKVNGSLWSVISVSNGQAVIEKDFDEKNGGGTDIYSLDLTTGKTQALSADRTSSLPRFAYPWVMWKAVPRYDWTTKLAIYNLQTHLRQDVPINGASNSDPRMNGTRVYWEGQSDEIKKTDTIYIFDIVKNTVYTFDTTEKNQRFDSIAIHGGLIAWARVTDTHDANPDYYLEWTTIK